MLVALGCNSSFADFPSILCEVCEAQLVFVQLRVWASLGHEFQRRMVLLAYWWYYQSLQQTSDIAVLAHIYFCVSLFPCLILACLIADLAINKLSKSDAMLTFLLQSVFSSLQLLHVSTAINEKKNPLNIPWIEFWLKQLNTE